MIESWFMRERRFNRKRYLLDSNHQSKESAQLRAKFVRKVGGRLARVVKDGRSPVTGKTIWQVYIS